MIKPTIWENTWSPGYTVLSYTDKEHMVPQQSYNASVILKKINRSLFKHANELKKELNIERVSFNNTLLSYYGEIENDGIQQVLYILTGIVMGIIHDWLHIAYL